jgi:DNA polymerase III delta prime subunit
MRQLWITAHRPKTIDQYVWRDLAMRQTVEDWIAARALPHCLFSGPPGTGKTSLAMLLLDVLDINENDILRINASRERKIDELQDKIIGFIQAWAFNDTGIKYILLDEADKLSQHAQGMLRSEMETYASVCRFILTCNVPRLIIPALHSRVQEIKFSTLNRNEFILRAAEVLIEESVQFEDDVLLSYVERTYPDLRKCLNALQQNSRDGQLQVPADAIEGTSDYLVGMVELFKAGRYHDGRKLLIAKALPEEYPDIFRYLYQNLGLFGADAQQSKALLVIRDAVRDHAIVADPEINMSALLCELSIIATEQTP